MQAPLVRGWSQLTKGAFDGDLAANEYTLVACKFSARRLVLVSLGWISDWICLITDSCTGMLPRPHLYPATSIPPLPVSRYIYHA